MPGLLRAPAVPGPGPEPPSGLQGRQVGGTDGAEGPRQHPGQHEVGPGQGRQGYTAVPTDSEFGSASSLPSSASGALSVQSGRGQSLPQGLGREGLREKLTGAGSLAQQVPVRPGQDSSDLHAVRCLQLHAHLALQTPWLLAAWDSWRCTCLLSLGSRGPAAWTQLCILSRSASRHAPPVKHQTCPPQ